MRIGSTIASTSITIRITASSMKDRAERHAREQQLPALRHAGEQHDRRPAKDHLDQATDLPADEGDERRDDRHAASKATRMPRGLARRRNPGRSRLAFRRQRRA